MESDGRYSFDATIAIGDSESAAIPLGPHAPLAMVLPAAFEANTVKILFKWSDDGSTFQLLRDKAGTLYSVTVAATNTNTGPYIEADIFKHMRFVQIGAYNSSDALVAQSSLARAITIVAGKVV